MAPGGIRTHDLSRRAAADLRLRRRDHRDRHLYPYLYLYLCVSVNFSIYVIKKLKDAVAILFKFKKCFVHFVL